MTNQQMKTLTKIRLINWHYFVDETIHINGSVLFSGENASGKSTILDAIQFVLTANAGHFNPAANEKSKRDLRGYVRCKTGEEGNTYVRNSGAVISYVALEFYEESKDRFFVLGVKLDSQDIESEISRKWFCVEGKLESLSFIVDGKPATDKDFLQNGKRVQLDRQSKNARETFRNRLGRLDDKFPEMISKSMAFKPINKVKDFIYQFILPANEIKTEVLQENIRNLREMQKLVNDVRQQIGSLQRIIEKADDIETKEYDILVIEILIAIAKVESLKQELTNYEKKKSSDEAYLAVLNKDLQARKSELNAAQNRLNDLNVAMASNECGRLIEKIEDEIRSINGEKAAAEQLKAEFEGYLNDIDVAIKTAGLDSISVSKPTFTLKTIEERIEYLESTKRDLYAVRDNAYKENSNAENEIDKLIKDADSLENKIDELRKNRMTYDRNTIQLRDAINEELRARRIDSEARIFADLLEIKLPEWRDAVEGYLNTQRFYIIVDPAYYDIAANVYDRMKDKIHSAGVVNTEKLLLEQSLDRTGTLAEAIRTDNRYARAYADYLLGRVVCCDAVSDLKQYSIAITKSCMKYQGHVLSKISPGIYKDPYIGQDALRVQLENAEVDLASDKAKISVLKSAIEKRNTIIKSINDCDFSAARARIDAAETVRKLSIKLQRAEEELLAAKGNPSFIELRLKLEAAQKAFETINSAYEETSKTVNNKERDIQDIIEKIKNLGESIKIAKDDKDRAAGDNSRALAEAENKYQDEVRHKTAVTIANNYGPRRQTLQNQRESILSDLVSYQTRYKDGDLGTGMNVMSAYREELYKLEKSDLISYEGKLALAQNECEIEFRENFLAKMRENIERASTIFGQLNKSLKGIYYGNDSYRFELSANKDRQSLYDMITSDINIGGQSLFSAAFEEKYHAEMEDLFSKLTDENLADSVVLKDLTDYRSYLDYDIKVISKDSRVQYFSKTYGEKSGGETQTPYYVAIAASFAQLYSDRETVRIIMLDEAFNNMDEDRIESMMQFFKSQNFQIILAAPPARMETIGEYVDSIYLTIRIPEKNISAIEEYFL